MVMKSENFYSDLFILPQTHFLFIFLMLIFSGISITAKASFSLPFHVNSNERMPTTISKKSTDTESVSLSAALHAFRKLSRQERKSRINDAKAAIKQYHPNNERDTDTFIQVVLAILLPPLAVYLHEQEFRQKFWISLLLTLLFWFPGVVYALIDVLW